MRQGGRQSSQEDAAVVTCQPPAANDWCSYSGYKTPHQTLPVKTGRHPIYQCVLYRESNPDYSIIKLLKIASISFDHKFYIFIFAHSLIPRKWITYSSNIHNSGALEKNTALSCKQQKVWNMLPTCIYPNQPSGTRGLLVQYIAYHCRGHGEKLFISQIKIYQVFIKLKQYITATCVLKIILIELVSRKIN